jgi:mRNA interferase RelE/StbE
MSITVKWEKSALKQAKSLEPEMRKRIWAAVRKVKEEKATIKKLSGREGEFRIRVGDYRVVFDLVGDVATIIDVGHRREVYR